MHNSIINITHNYDATHQVIGKANTDIAKNAVKFGSQITGLARIFTETISRYNQAYNDLINKLELLTPPEAIITALPDASRPTIILSERTSPPYDNFMCVHLKSLDKLLEMIPSPQDSPRELGNLATDSAIKAS